MAEIDDLRLQLEEQQEQLEEQRLQVGDQRREAEELQRQIEEIRLGVEEALDKFPLRSTTTSGGGKERHIHDLRFHPGGMSILDRDLSQVDVADTTTETSLYSHSIPANTLGVTGGVRVTMGGDLLHNAVGTVTILVKLGATTVLSAATLAFGDDAQRYKWFMEIVAMNSSTSAQKWIASFHTAVRSDTFAARVGNDALAVHILGYNTSTEDTTGALTLDVTVEWTAADASLSFRKEMAFMELLPAK